MNNLVLTSIFLFLFFSSIQSQANLEWEARYNGPTANDKGNKVVVDDDGNVYVTGKSDGTSASDYLTIKYNAKGDTLWTARYNGASDGEDEALAILVDRNGNVYVTGKSKGINTGFDIITIKYNSSGIQQWVSIFNGSLNKDDIGYDLAIDVFSNVYVCGSAGTFVTGVVLKISPIGTIVWFKFQNNSRSTNVIKINHLGNVVCASGIAYTSSFYTIYELNSSDGATIFAYNDDFFSDKSPGWPESMTLDNAGNMYVLSSHQSNSFSIDPPDQINVSKFTRGFDNRTFYYFWTVGGQNSIRGVDLKIDKNSDLYLLADFFSGFHGYFISKINVSSNMTWQKTYKSLPNIDDFPINLALSNLTDPPEIFVTGFNSIGNINTLKYRNNGDTLWTKKYDCGNNGADAAGAMVIDKCDNLYITGTSACNNTFQDVKTIKYSTANLPLITKTGTNPFCEGDTITLSTTSCTGCTYLWSTGETSNSIIVSPDSTTSYTVKINYPSNCELTSLPEEIIVKPLTTPEITINTASTSVCTGDNVVFNATPVNGGGNPVYMWYINSELQTGNMPTFATTSLENGDKVTCTLISNVNCITMDTAISNEIIISVFPILQTGISLTSSEISICGGESITFTAFTINGGVSPLYQWYVNEELQQSQTGSEFTTILNQSSNIYVRMTSNETCPNPIDIVSDTISILVNPLLLPEVNINASADTICEGELINFTAIATNGGNSPTYQWYVDGILQSTTTNNFSGNSFSNNSNVFCIMNSSEICVINQQDTSNVISLSVIPKVTPFVEITSDLDTICEGTNVIFTAQIIHGGEAPAYFWYIDSILQNGNGNTFSTSNLLNGSEVFCMLTSNAICLNQTNAISNTISFTVHSSPIVTILADGPTTFCLGNSVNLSVNDAVSYYWSTEATSQSIDVFDSGNMMVTITDENGCTAFSSIAVTVNPLPSANISLSGSSTFCIGGSVTLTADSALEYLWSTTETSQSINVTSEGGYSVTVTDGNGCSAFSSPTTITVNPLPVAMIVPEGPTTFCQGENVILVASEAQSYLWSTGQTSRSVDVTSQGVYTVTITDSNGCSAISSEIMVTVNPILTPTLSISPSNNVICMGENVTFSSLTTNTGTSPTYQWFINGLLQTETGPTFSTTTLSNNDQVLCRMNSNAECLSQSIAQSNTISIAVNPLVTPEVSINTLSNSILSCQNVTFTAIPTNGGLTPTFQWFLNDILVGSSIEFTTSVLIDGDKVSCRMLSAATCKSAPSAESNIITMSVSPLTQPSIIVTGDTISSDYNESQYQYSWYFNGNEVSQSPFIICSQFGSGSYYLVINYNGCIVTSNAIDIVCTVSTKDIDIQNYFVVYPNPTSSILNIYSKNISSNEFSIEIYNILGQKLKTKRISILNANLITQLDLSEYINGVYTIAVYSDKQKQVFKVFKIE